MITIYGSKTCSWCEKAKKLADTFSLKYDYIDVSDPDKMAELKAKKPDVKTIPQIWWFENYIGGYEQFAKEVENTLGGTYGQGKV